MEKGKIYSESQFYVVEKVAGDKVQLLNDGGEHVVVTKDYITKCLSSANDFTKTTKCTKTELAGIFTSNVRIAMTVCFMKQVKEADVIAEVMKAYEGSTYKAMESAIKKAVKAALNGEERVMIGRHDGAVDDFGRIHFVDMSLERDMTKTYDTRFRLVDPRTIQYIIVNNIKYELK